MRPVFVIIEQVGRHQPFEMPLIQDDHVVQQVASATSHQRSATPLCHGLRKAVRVGWLPMFLTAESTSAPNFAPRSSSKNLYGCLQAHASRNCCTTQSALGFCVTLKCRIFRRSWPMTKKQYRTPNVSVGTVKKSIAAMASRRFLRNVSHRFTESGSLGDRRIHRETLLSESSNPSLSSSP